VELAAVAFMEYYVPGRTREQKDAALADWRRAAESFQRRRDPNGRTGATHGL